MAQAFTLICSSNIRKGANKYALACWFILLICMGGCEKDVSDKLRFNVLNQLVLVSFISPQDTAIIVRLQRTQPAVGKEYRRGELIVPDAIVTLSDGTTSIPLKYISSRDVYRADKTALLIAAGKTYSLQVSTPDGFKASGQATVPFTDGVSITDYAFGTPRDFNTGNGSVQLYNILNFKWIDAPDRENYYQTLAFRQAPDPANPNKPFSTEISVLMSKAVFKTDEGKGGQELTSNNLSFLTPKPDNFPKPYDLHLIVAVTDKAYYLYHKSVLDQLDVSGNPFAEPALIYTNITGGLGVFAAYNQVKTIRRIN